MDKVEDQKKLPYLFVMVSTSNTKIKPVAADSKLNEKCVCLDVVTLVTRSKTNKEILCSLK